MSVVRYIHTHQQYTEHGAAEYERGLADARAALPLDGDCPMCGVRQINGEPAIVEAWNGTRKVTVYPGLSVLRVWGTNMDTEMSDEPHTLKSAADAFDWLYDREAAQSIEQARELSDEEIDRISAAKGLTWYVPGDYDSFLWSRIDTEQLRRIVRSCIAAARSPQTGKKGA